MEEIDHLLTEHVNQIVDLATTHHNQITEI